MLRQALRVVSNLPLAFVFAASSASAAVVYSNTFETSVGSEWSASMIDVTPNGGRRFLGRFSVDSASLTLENLPPHVAVTVSFDLFTIFSWDGNEFTTFGPDIISLVADGATPVLYTTFSNAPAATTQYRQAYPDPYPGGDHPPKTGAIESNALGFPEDGNDAVYRITRTFPHDGAALVLTWRGIGLQGVSDESWGLDNVVVEMDVVPDPDQDGVPDAEEAELCRGTASGVPVTAVGCSVDQVCPCSAPYGRVGWSKRGEYRRCVNEAATEMYTSGRISAVERNVIKRSAKTSSCGLPGAVTSTTATTTTTSTSTTTTIAPGHCEHTGGPCLNDDDCGIPGACAPFGLPICVLTCTTSAQCPAGLFCFFAGEWGGKGICDGCGDDASLCPAGMTCPVNTCEQGSHPECAGPGNCTVREACIPAP